MESKEDEPCKNTHAAQLRHFSLPAESHTFVLIKGVLPAIKQELL
jgi:hypothetical protein